MRARLLLVLAAAAALPSSPAEGARYTLAQLIAKVTAEYSGVQVAREQLAAAEAQMSQANRLLWPTGQLTFGLTGSPEIRCANAAGFSDPNQAIRQSDCVTTTAVDLRSNLDKVLPFHGVAFNFNITLVQPLLSFGKIAAVRRGAGAGRDAAQGGIDQAKADVKMNVTRAYWGIKWARAARATLEDGVERLKGWTKKINDELEAGRGGYTETDLIRLKLALDTAELALVDIGRGADIALAGLRTLAEDPEAEVDEDELEETEPVERPLAYYDESARLNRPEARMLAAARTAVHAGRNLRLAELMPDLGVVGSFTYGYAQGVDTPQNAFMNRPNVLGLGLAVVLRAPLDIPLRLARFAQSRAEDRAMQVRSKQALGGISFEVSRAFADAEEARRRSRLLGHSEKVARGWYNAVDQSLQVGVAEARDLVDAARHFFELRLRHLQSIMDVNVTTAALRMAAGVK